MQNEICLENAARFTGDIFVDVVRMLVQQILDLRETLSFYEREVFASEAAPGDEAAPSPECCSEAASQQWHADNLAANPEKGLLSTFNRKPPLRLARSEK